MNKIRVLVFPAGEINALELHDALAACVNVEVFGASSIERHGAYIFANYISGLPMIDEPGFMDAFIQVVKEHKIDLIFPTHDTVAEFLTAKASAIPARILGGDAYTCQVCRDKAKTCALFKDEPFCPNLCTPRESLPVFVKPRIGQGSKGAHLVEDWKELENLDLRDWVVCEYLPGEEFTVDCLTDNEGRLRFVSPRSRLRVMAGISMAGKTEPLTPEIEHIAQTINSRLNFLGLWWFQIKRDAGGRWKLLEISARCAGSMVLTRSLGVNLPLLSIYTAIGREISIAPNNYQAVMDSAIIRRFRLPVTYGTVYIDFDDTLIVNNKVNLKAVWFLYQCHNENKKIVLLTKHENNIYESLNNYGLCANLFSQIVETDIYDDKSNYITDINSIFIDNSWKEREKVRTLLDIPVFDVDGIDFLLAWQN